MDDTDLNSSFCIGLEADTIEDAKRISMRFITSKQQSWKYYKTAKDKHWWVVCKLGKKECPFQIKFQYIQRTGRWQLVAYEAHTCPLNTHQKWQLQNAVDILSTNENNIALVSDDTKIKPQTLATHERNEFGVKPPYLQLWRTRRAINTKLFGEEGESFQKIPALIALMEVDVTSGKRTAWGRCETKDGRFHRCVIVPRATAHASEKMTQFWALDATHCTARHRLTLLAVTGLDGNHNSLPLAWALVPAENKEHWDWFLRFITRHLKVPNGNDAVVMSDRGKGLVFAVERRLPKAQHLNCAQHLADNVRKFHTQKCVKYLWNVVYARSEAEFEKAMRSCRKESDKCAEYIMGCNIEHFAGHKIDRPRYGQVTSNIQEGMNSQWLNAREKPVFYCLLEIWNDTMAKIKTRRTKPMKKNKQFTDFAADYLATESKAGSKYRTQSSTDTVAIVNCGYGVQHRVDMEAKQCTCRKFQDYKLLCRHAYSVCHDNNLEIDEFISSEYSKEVYRDTYDSDYAMPPLLVGDLQSDRNCQAPKVYKLSGRPQKKRIRTSRKPGHLREVTCGGCGQTGHNSRTCRYGESPDHSSFEYSGSSESEWNGFSDDANDDADDESSLVDKRISQNDEEVEEEDEEGKSAILFVKAAPGELINYQYNTKAGHP